MDIDTDKETTIVDHGGGESAIATSFGANDECAPDEKRARPSNESSPEKKMRAELAPTPTKEGQPSSVSTNITSNANSSPGPEDGSARKERKQAAERVKEEKARIELEAQEAEEAKSMLKSAKLMAAKAANKKRDELKKADEQRTKALEKAAKESEKEALKRSKEGAGSFKKDLKDATRNAEKVVEKLDKEIAVLEKAQRDAFAHTAEGKAHAESLVLKAKASVVESFAVLGQPEPLLAGCADWVPGEVLRLYDTCSSFSKALGLTPFAFEELVSGLKRTKSESVLVCSVGMALLKAVLSPVRRTTQTVVVGGSLAASSQHHRKPASAKLLDEPFELDDAASGGDAGVRGDDARTSAMKDDGGDDGDAGAGGAVAAAAARISGLLATTPPHTLINALTWQHLLFHVLTRSCAAEMLLNTAPLPSPPPIRELAASVVAASASSASASSASSSSYSASPSLPSSATTTTSPRTLWGDHLARAGSLKSGLKHLRGREMHSLPLEEKLSLLGALALLCYESGNIADEMAHRSEQRLELEKSRREDELEENRRKRDEKAVLKEEALEVLKEEKKEELLNLEKKGEEDKAKQLTMDGFLNGKGAGGGGRSSPGGGGGGGGSPRGGGGKAGSPKGGGSPRGSMKASSSVSSFASSDGGGGGTGPSKSHKKKKKDEEADDDIGEKEGSGGKGKVVKAGSDKEWAPSHFAVAAKVRELEELELFGGQEVVSVAEVLGFADLFNSTSGNGVAKYGSKKSDAAATVFAQAALDEALKEEAAVVAQREVDDAEEESGVLQLTMSRTALLQRRKDRDGNLKAVRDKVRECEDALTRRSRQTLCLESMDQALKGEPNAFASPSASAAAAPQPQPAVLTRAGIAKLLKDASACRLFDEERCVPQVRELQRKLEELKEKDARTKKESKHLLQMQALLVRREPLAVITFPTAAPQTATAAVPPPLTAPPMVLSLWSFGATHPPLKALGGKKKRGGATEEGAASMPHRLWAMVHSPLLATADGTEKTTEGTAVAPWNASSSSPSSSSSSSSSTSVVVDSSSKAQAFATAQAASSAVLGKQGRWLCVSEPEKLRKFVACVEAAGAHDEQLKSLREKLGAELIDSLVELEDGEEDGESGNDDTEWALDHEWVGQKVKRHFTNKSKGRVVSSKDLVGTVVGWLSAEANEGLALWHVKHDDGDYDEDLEDFEVGKAIALWDESEEKKSEAQDAQEAEAEKTTAMDEGDDDGDAKESQAKTEGSGGAAGTEAAAVGCDEGGAEEEEEDEDEDAPWRLYVNKMSTGKHGSGAAFPKGEDQLGVGELQARLLLCEEQCLDGIKEREKALLKAKLANPDATSSQAGGLEWYARGKGGRASWRESVREAKDGVAGLAALLVTFEEALRQLQTAPDDEEGDEEFLRKRLVKEGWQCGVGIGLNGKPDDPDPGDKDAGVESGSGGGGEESSSSSSSSPPEQQQPHEWVGRLVRKFYPGADGKQKKQDGKLIAWMPLNEDEEDEPAVWRMMHADGDQEDLEEGEVVKAMDAYDEDLDEPEDDDQGNGGDDEEEEEEEEEEEDDIFDEDEEEEEEEEEEEDEAKRRLWATAGIREKWRQAAGRSLTVAQLAIASNELHDAANDFGVTKQAMGSKESRALGKGSGGGGRGGAGARSLPSVYAAMAVSGRAAAAKASQAISKQAHGSNAADEDEDEDDEDDEGGGFGRKRRSSSRGSGKSSSRGGGGGGRSKSSKKKLKRKSAANASPAKRRGRR